MAGAKPANLKWLGVIVVMCVNLAIAGFTPHFTWPFRQLASFECIVQTIVGACLFAITLPPRSRRLVTGILSLAWIPCSPVTVLCCTLLLRTLESRPLGGANLL
jgi:hypothetical protein